MTSNVIAASATLSTRNSKAVSHDTTQPLAASMSLLTLEALSLAFIASCRDAGSTCKTAAMSASVILYFFRMASRSSKSAESSCSAPCPAVSLGSVGECGVALASWWWKVFIRREQCTATQYKVPSGFVGKRDAECTPAKKTPSERRLAPCASSSRGRHAALSVTVPRVALPEWSRSSNVFFWSGPHSMSSCTLSLMVPRKSSSPKARSLSTSSTTLWWMLSWITIEAVQSQEGAKFLYTTGDLNVSVPHFKTTYGSELFAPKPNHVVSLAAMPDAPHAVISKMPSDSGAVMRKMSAFSEMA
mmetsp:Transcript_80871/g.247141  ORF Transcript_80871/g.247141 Transcript_80871/m.247141 type:complete len:302 (-) Transcript_80871:559-1464(-)